MLRCLDSTCNKPFLWNSSVNFPYSYSDLYDTVKAALCPQCRDDPAIDWAYQVVEDYAFDMQGTAQIYFEYYYVLNGDCRGQIWHAKRDEWGCGFDEIISPVLSESGVPVTLSEFTKTYPDAVFTPPSNLNAS